MSGDARPMVGTNVEAKQVGVRKDNQFERHRSDTTVEQPGNETWNGCCIVNRIGKPQQ